MALIKDVLSTTGDVLSTTGDVLSPTGIGSTLSVSPDEYGLLTDLYQLTMSACYTGEGLHQRPASFELFTRRLPEGYGYLVAMGLEQALSYLENLRFSPAQILQLQKQRF